ncbi:sulfotransferase family protein [Flavobacterium sp. XGLA_31]|uniref:sulfotransferase family protein n=1 Tax=Flavobacterium sp. XGLA_31 TaxID=3447666 RepID=UPI003F4036CA
MKKIFVIGGMKCGTSSLYQMFKSNDEVCLSKFKEPSFFTKRFQNGMDWYQNQFEPTEKAKYLMDVSPSYSKVHLFPHCAKRIHEYDADARIIYIVRDPLERIVSNIYHDLLRGRLTTKQIVQVLASDENYINTSAYNSQIKPYIDLFGKKNVLILQFEELKSNLPEFNKKISDFLGIDFYVDVVAAQNVSENRYLIKYYDVIHSRFGNSFISKMYFLLWRLINKKVSKPKLSQEELNFIYNKLQSDIEEFIPKFQINESLWKVWSAAKNNE